MVASIYLRVSTDQQADSGAGLNAQEDACRSYCKKNDIMVGCLHRDEGFSGTLPMAKRPGLMSAIDALGHGDVLVVAKRDRLGRDLINVAMIEALVSRKGASVVSAAGEGTENQDDPASQLLRRIIDAFSEYAVAILRERTKKALRAKRDRGERTGHVPFGFKVAADGIHLEPDQIEKSKLSMMQELRLAGESYQSIADAMNERQCYNRMSRPWNAVLVRQILVARN